MNRLSVFSPACLAIVVLSASLAGCGSGTKLYSVTGTVTYKGAPVEGAEVRFLPVKEDLAQKPARGTTDSSGKFSVKTFLTPSEDRSGAMAGLYKVTLEKIPPSTGIVDPYKPGGMPKNELPAKYADPKQTPFEFEVKTSGGNDLPLSLTD